MGNYVWPNYYVGNTYQDELVFLKTWISNRLAWIDSNILGHCYMISGCTDPIACNYDPFANTNDGSCNYNTSSYDTLFSNVSVLWNGMMLLSSGDYTFTLSNSVGCDSTINLNFTINPLGLIDVYNKRVLIKITDMLGRNTRGGKNNPLFYIYSDGTVEKKVIIE